MITSNIGKIFLDAYNEEYGTNYDARTFFLEQFYPLFLIKQADDVCNKFSFCARSTKLS